MQHSKRSTVATVEKQLKEGLKLHHAGQLLEAATLYEAVLQGHPSDGDALHLLGTVALQTGHYEQATRLIKAAIKSNPAIAEFHLSLGSTFHRTGKLQDALASFDSALFLNPNFASAHLNKARVLEQLGDLHRAAESYRKAGEIDRALFEAYLRSGVVLLKLGQPDRAIESCKHALSLEPDSAEGHFNLGHAFEATEQFDPAAASYREAIRLNPRLAEAHNNLGNVLRKLNDLEGAVSAFSAAVSLQPDFAIAIYNLATTLSDKKAFQAAIQHYQAAISLNPRFADAYYNLGNAYRELGDHEPAQLAYAKALSVNPRFAICYTALGMTLADLGRDDEAMACYRESLRLEPDNPDTFFGLANVLRHQNKLTEAVSCLEKALELRPTFKNALSNLLFHHATIADISPEEQRRLAERWECSALTQDERLAARKVTFIRAPRSGRKLRLGILSAEIGQHSVSEFLEPFLSGVDHTRFHLTLFPSFIRQEPRARRIISLADCVVPIVDLSDKAAAELVRGSEIDILVDTTGHTRHCRLGVCAHRAAPVQVSYIGYWSTTGLTEMDWILADHDTPAYMDAQFCERIWRLPRIGNCYFGDLSLPLGPWQPAPDHTIWLGSFNRYIKIREATLALWAKIMNALPESKLLLEDRRNDCSGHHDRILRCLGEYGIAAGRIQFEPFIPGHERHMRLYDRLDIALDTIPFNSGTTACDALWMGVPLVAIEGNWAGGRMAASILRAAGLGHWVAQDEDDYVSIVTRLARDVSGRQQLRLTQRDQMAHSELCDSVGLNLAIQDAFASMFDEFQARNA